jgi:hypothetical protein
LRQAFAEEWQDLFFSRRRTGTEIPLPMRRADELIPSPRPSLQLKRVARRYRRPCGQATIYYP